MGLIAGDKTKIADSIGPIEVQKVVGPGTEQMVTYQSFWEGQVRTYCYWCPSYFCTFQTGLTLANYSLQSPFDSNWGRKRRALLLSVR